MFVDSVLNSAANMADTPQIVQEPYSDTSSRGLHHREQRMSDTDKEEKCGSDGGKMEVFETELNGENGQEGHRHLKILPLAMIIFYNVSGGPFGMEESVRSAGFLFSILGFIIMPIVWSIPEALVTAELGSTYPEASGGVAWADEAFGPAAGWMTGYLGWMAGATDNAIYPVLFLDYLCQIWSESSEITPTLRFLLLSSTSIFLGYLNWRGLQFVGNMTIIIGLLSMSPFVIMTIIGAFKVDPQRWFEIGLSHSEEADQKGILTTMTSGAILWRPFLNTLFWNLNSWDSTASFAGEVERPGYTLPRSMFLAIIFVMAGYLLPLIVIIGATTDSPDAWVDGYLTDAAEEIGGEWLGAWVVFAAGVSNIALFQAELSADAFQLMGMAERGFVPKFFGIRSRHGTPTYGILLGVGVIIAMASFNLEKLIEMLNFNYALALLIEYSAFIKLRISKPLVPRPFRIPFSTTGCVIFLVAPVGTILLLLCLSSVPTLLFSLGVNLFGVCVYYFNNRREASPYRCCKKYAKVENNEFASEVENNVEDIPELN